MCVAVIKMALRTAFAFAWMPFRMFSATILHAGSRVLYFTWGGHSQVDMTPARRALSEKRMPAAPISFPTHGGGGYGVRGERFVIEMTGAGGGAMTTGGKYTVNAGGGSGFLNVGFMVKRGSYLRVYPLVGLGGGGAGVMVAGDPDSAINDGDSPGDQVGAGTGGPLVNLGLGLEFKLGSRFGVMAGIRFGVVFAPFGRGGVTTLTPYAHFVTGVGTFRGRRKRPNK